MFIRRVLDFEEGGEDVLMKAHSSKYSIHPGSTKINCNTREVYWWESTKMFIVEFVPKYSNCQQVKVEYHRPGGLAQNIQLPECKWEMINMDFIRGLPKFCRQHDSSWLIVDRMTKSAHFLPVKTTHLADDYAKLYI